MINKFIEELKSKDIHIVGAAGIEGSAVAVFLYGQEAKKVTLHDFSEKAKFEESYKNSRSYLKPGEADESFKRLISTGYKICYKNNYLKGVENADIIFISQGWYRYESNKKLKELKGKIAFSSVTELYFELSPCPIIGITGTVGKSTTTRLIFEMLKKCGKKAYISGNDRDNPPVLDKLLKISKDSYLVLEVSNRQLIDLEYSPHIAVVTNIFPNHPDDHKDFAEYIKVKSNIVKYQTKSDSAVLNADIKESAGLKSKTLAKTYLFSIERAQKNGAYLKDNYIWLSINGSRGKLIEIDKIKLPGAHNILNIMSSLLVGHIVRLDKNRMVEALINFKGLKHRLEFITNKKGISFYEDSQSTSPYSTTSAIEAFKGKKMILIAGGFRAGAKEADYSETVEKFFMPHLKAVVLIGKVAPIIQNEYYRQKRTRAHGPDFIRNCGNLPEAMKQVKKLAEKGDNVVLSPGAESFGEFKDYRDRGEKFKKLVLKF